MQILVVEDDFISRRLICRYLEAFGDCDVAINGTEAVEAVHNALEAGSHYDLICLDIMMPGMSGQEALIKIRDLEQAQGLADGRGAKVVMTSALEEEENVSQADCYVRKPIEKQKLIATLQALGFALGQPA